MGGHDGFGRGAAADEPERDVLVCYRGRYRDQVERLVAELERAGLTVDYDERILGTDGDAPVAGAPDPVGASDVEERWRAPIKAAIRSSELVVFLVPYVNDISDNVWDEVDWVATQARHIFVVFDVRVDLDEEGEALLISSIQTRWMLRTMTVDHITSGTSPPIPEFPYHVVSHSDESHIDDQIRTLANRVVVALDDYRHDRVRSADAASDITMDDVRNSPGRQRRRRVHDVQAAAAERFGIVREDGRDPLRAVIDNLATRERDLTPAGDLLVAPDGFRYPAALERARFARAQLIAERMRPSPFEIPVVFATLCYEAAGVEMLLEERGAPARAAMWGTLPFSTLAEPVMAALPGELLFWIDSAFADLAYQAAKTSVMVWSSVDGGMRVDPAGVGERLSRDPTPALALVASLRQFGAMGRPSSTTDGAPPPELHRPIGLLTRFAERYVMAYGYLLATADDPGSGDVLAAEAATVAMQTGLKFDLVDPSIGLQGCIHAEACLALARHSRLDRDGQPLDGRDEYVAKISAMAKQCYQLYVGDGADHDFAVEATDHACDAGSTPLVLADLAGFSPSDR